LGLKGIVFTLDSIVAFGIMVFVISFLIFFRTETSSPYLTAQQLHSMSEDILSVFSESKLREVTNQSLLQQYINDSILNETDLDKKTIDILGALWSAGKDEEAANMTEDILDAFIPNNLGYQLLINNSNVYNSSNISRPNYEDSSVEISSARIASGYEKYQPTEGYVARALARTIKKNNTLIVMGDVISSSVTQEGGWGSNQNEPNISYIFDLPDDATILDAYWFIESSYWNNRLKAYMNGVYIPGSDARTRVLLENIESYIHTGHNEGNVVWRHGGGQQKTGGDDGATHLVVIYNTSQVSTLEEFEKVYFQTVISNCSINYKKPVFVLGEISNLSVRLNLTNGTQVNIVSLKFRWKGIEYDIGTKNPINGVVEWNDTEIRNVLNSAGISYDILDGRYFWFIVDVDIFHERENNGYERKIVGNDSYVHVIYSKKVDWIYNYIDLTRTISNYTYSEPDQYEFYRYAGWNFNLTNRIQLMARWQFPWIYISPSNPLQLARANDITVYNHNPSNPSSDPLIKEFARFGYDTNPEGVLISGDNKFELNFSDGYAVDPENSLGHTTFLVPVSVSYGDIFETEINATDDAIQRLENLLGEDVSAMDITVESVSVAGVPYMWGPVEVRLRMWV